MALTDKQIAEEEAFLEGLPRFNVAAFLLPPIWGPAHGIWPTILFYPIWLFADNMFYAAYENPTVVSIALALVVLVSLAAGTAAFAVVSQPFAAHRAERMGVSRETYLRRQKWWVVGCAVAGVVMLALATYYNLVIRPTVGA